MSEGAVLVELCSVTKRFAGPAGPVTALEDLTAAIRKGAVTGLIGPDGAGKSTLIRLIVGMYEPDAGEIRFRERSAGIAYMPQGTGLYDDLSVEANMALHADLRGLTSQRRADRFDTLLERTGLAEFRSRLAGRLSGGMRQKLALACALVEPPALLLLDEPSAGVDPLSRRELWSFVQDLTSEGIAVLWSTAYLDEAERCDEVIVLASGRSVFAGLPADFTERVEGRTFMLQAPGQTLRTLQGQLLAAPPVLDVVRQAGGLRLVLREAGDPPALETLVDEGMSRNKDILRNAELSAVEPRFEDALVAALKQDVSDRSESVAAGEDSRKDAFGRSDAKDKAGDATAIVAEDLTRRFGDFTAVDRVGFEVNYGQVFGLVGPNGAGKSTIFKMLCGLVPPSSGIAHVAGVDIGRAAASARAQIGYMSQHFALYADLSVLRNLNFFAAVYGLPARRRRERVEEMLSSLGLDTVADQPSGTLPLGFKQRLSLACAIMHAPQVLFLDEPTSGVDPLVRREFWLHINRMAESGVAILVTTHFMEEAEYCDRLAIIDRGKIIAIGPPRDITEEYAGKDTETASVEDAFIALLQRRRQDDSEAAT